MKHEVITIPSPDPFNFNESLWFLDRNLDDCMHRVSGDYVRKLIVVESEPILIQVSGNNQAVKIEILYGNVAKTQLVSDYVTEWLDLDRNIKPFYVLIKKDKELVPLIKAYAGFRMVGIPDLFEALCWCVMGQQINLDFAYRIKRRFVEQYGLSVTYDHEQYYLFPEEEVIKEVSIDELRSFQLTVRKSEYILGIARLMHEGLLSKQLLLDLENEEQMLQKLKSIRGIGDWTANYALMKCIRAMNCIPYGDVGVNNALFSLKGIEKKDNRLSVDALFSHFTGWKTYLVFYLWRSLR